MADPVATVEKIVRIGLKIKDAVDTVRKNEEVCNEIRRRVLRFSAILSHLQQTGTISNSPTMSGALEDLEEILQHALELVTACQETSTIRRLITAGDLSKKLREVKDDIQDKVMLASFAVTTTVLLTVQAGGHPLPQHPEDGRVMDISHNIGSTENARSELSGEENIVLAGSDDDSPLAPLQALRRFRLSELKAAIVGAEIIGEGGYWKVYKCVLNDGNGVAIKIRKGENKLLRRPHYQLLLASKLENTNIVKVLGYGCEVGYFSGRTRTSEHRQDLAHEEEFVWVEEYMPDGSLDMIIRDHRLDWPSLSRVIEGVAQGIHYLHEQNVVLRDVKPSNIVLDSDMTPKITDFDLFVVTNGDEITDYNIAGTLGYAPPEYVTEGIVSKKNDVYGFGVTLLQTVSSMYRSKRRFSSSTDIPPHQQAAIVEVIAKAWNAWETGQMEFLDPSLFDGPQLLEMKRYTQVGLLCVQDERADRPTMADVLEMLHDGERELITPEKPSFINSVKKRPVKKGWRAGADLQPVLELHLPRCGYWRPTYPPSP